MADYCSASDVKILLGYSEDFDANTSPTLTEVETLISIQTSDLDFFLESVGIPVQPTNSNLTQHLRLACMYCVAGLISLAGQGNQENVKSTMSEKLLEKCEKIKEMIIKNKSNYGAVEDVSTKFISSDYVDGTSNKDTYDNSYVDIDYQV